MNSALQSSSTPRLRVVLSAVVGVVLMAAGMEVVSAAPLNDPTKEHCPDANAYTQHIDAELKRIPPNRAAYDTDLQSFLHPDCFHLSQGWWEYEFCYGRWLRQYHQEKGVILNEYYLGLGPNWAKLDAVGSQKLKYTDGDFTVVEKIKIAELRPDADGAFFCQKILTDSLRKLYKHTLQKKRQDPSQAMAMEIFDQLYHPETTAANMPHGIVAFYNGGTRCDVGERAPRVTDIIPVCDRTGIIGDGMKGERELTMNISEVRPCVYQVLLTGPLVCRAMQLPVERRSPQSSSSPASSSSSSSAQKGSENSRTRHLNSQQRPSPTRGQQQPGQDQQAAGKRNENEEVGGGKPYVLHGKKLGEDLGGDNGEPEAIYVDGELKMTDELRKKMEEKEKDDEEMAKIDTMVFTL